MVLSMKNCASCGFSKEESDFYFKNETIGRRMSQCKSCLSENGKKRWLETGHIRKSLRNKGKAEARLRFVGIPSDSERICSGCHGDPKPKSSFTASGWVFGYCKVCRKSQNKVYRSTNSIVLKVKFRERYDNGLKETIVKTNQSRRAKTRKMIAALKDAPCVDCSCRFDWFVMEFDHIGEKTYGLGEIARRGWTLDRIKTEIAKCELVCSCCHRLRTASRLSEPTSYRPGEKVKRDLIESHKSAPCLGCHGSFLPIQMDFDHVRGEKVGILSRMFKKSVAAIMAEIAKCEIVCANCHKRRTYLRKQHLQQSSFPHFPVSPSSSHPESPNPL